VEHRRRSEKDQAPTWTSLTAGILSFSLFLQNI
jgi:hypothetical protein